MSDDMLLRRLERFLYDEVDLLDSWKLPEWKELFTADGRYLITPLNVENAETVEQGKVLFLANDNMAMITGRVERLMKKSAHVESPRSNVRHLLNNIRILSRDNETLRACANFLVYRARRTMVTQYVGRAFYTLSVEGESFRIREKRICLDNDILQPQGSIGIIL
jgi:p-cumate 2,3-dioxygenase subunit beta